MPKTVTPRRQPNRTDISNSPWRTIFETAEYLRVAELTVHAMIADGRLTAYSLGQRVVRLHIADIDAALGRSA